MVRTADSPPVPHTSRWSRVLLALGLALAAVPVAGSDVRAQGNDATAQDVGAWDLAFEKGNRRCRLVLKDQGAGAGYDLALPAGCRKAFPLLAGVTTWRPAEGNHVVFVGLAGQPLMDFAPAGGMPLLAAVASENDVYTLTPTDLARQAALALDPGGAAAVSAAPSAADTAVPAPAPRHAPAPTRAVTLSEVAGNYAVVRSGKDTGCMVVLDDKARGPQAALKARLAPACRDQGIVIFDPVGWQLSRNALVLTARKGHSTALNLQDDGTWSNAPATGKALVLKRL